MYKGEACVGYSFLRLRWLLTEYHQGSRITGYMVQIEDVEDYHKGMVRFENRD